MMHRCLLLHSAPMSWISDPECYENGRLHSFRQRCLFQRHLLFLITLNDLQPLWDVAPISSFSNFASGATTRRPEVKSPNGEMSFLETEDIDNFEPPFYELLTWCTNLHQLFDEWKIRQYTNLPLTPSSAKISESYCICSEVNMNSKVVFTSAAEVKVLFSVEVTSQM